MPELPEVEEAMQRLRTTVEGKMIAKAIALHQLIHLANGSSLHAHLRMNGDWPRGAVNLPVSEVPAIVKAGPAVSRAPEAARP